jgi:ribonucleoside-diphosphate reductase alpha chain
MAKSLVDYIFRYMATKFMSQSDKDAVGIINRQLTLSDAPAVSAAPTEATEPSGLPASHGASTSVDAGPGRSAGGDEATTESTQTGSSVAGPASEAPATEASADAAVPIGGETVGAKPETVAGGLLDGLKIVAQNSEAADRAERLAAGQAPVVFDTADSPACTDCGSIMVRNGSCYKCINCGATSGCS